MVTHIEHHSLSEEVAEYLLTHLLVSDQYPRGTYIREEEVARSLDISRAPVREALRILDSQGLVRSIPRRGALVLDYSEEDVAELYDIRFALESQVFDAIVRGGLLTPEIAGRLRTILDEMVEVSRSGLGREEKVIAFTKKDLQFHLLLSECSGRRWTHHLLKGIYSQLQIAMIRDLKEEKHLEVSALEHVKILDELLAGDLENIRENRHYSYFHRRLHRENAQGGE
jgi:DNA-binding GntR family transcriptional regulator